jgi:predicted adenylyl cyclase CyaB
MNRNVEIKARVSNFAAIRSAAGEIADGPPTLVEHEDTFFRCPNGRLKVRRLSSHLGELIYYERHNTAEPAESRYIRAATGDPDLLVRALSHALAIRGVVRKTRTLYMSGQTRIHFDEVEGLGQFVELEVVLASGQPFSDGLREARHMMNRLGIQQHQLVDQAYIDLLERRGVPPPDP